MCCVLVCSDMIVQFMVLFCVDALCVVFRCVVIGLLCYLFVMFGVLLRVVCCVCVDVGVAWCASLCVLYCLRGCVVVFRCVWVAFVVLSL